MTPPTKDFFILTILCQGKLADGRPYWAYLDMHAVKAKAFKQAQESGVLNLESFGDVVCWGIGDDVPPEEKTRMERDYGVNHDFVRDAREILTKQRHEVGKSRNREKKP